MPVDTPAAELAELVWASAFETGDAKVDGQHRELAVDLNNLSHCLTEGKGWPHIVTMTKQLRDKCFAHFRDEETLLARSRFEKLAAHERDHRYIEKQLDDVLACIGSATRPSPAHIEAVLYLRSMLIHHFFRFDIAYKAHLLRPRRKGSQLKRRKISARGMEP
jgi:hemerythrin